MQFLVSLIVIQRPILLPDSFIRFQFQINVLLNSMQILFTDMRQGTTNYKVQG